VATPIPANAAPLTAWSAAAATGGRLARARDGGAAARGITSDSRAVTNGCAFVALRGAKYDGHDFVAAAVRAGASLVVVENGEGGRAPRDASVDVVEVDDTLAAWGDLARAHLRAWRRGRGDARVLAVTGSAGKTTTKELCAALLGATTTCHAAPGNLNNLVGVPAVAFGVEPRHHVAVFELGMSTRGEIARLARVVEPDVAVITNVGVAHAEGVGGTRADVAREKGELFAALAESSVAVACFDDDAAMGQLARTRARRASTFGVGAGAGYRLIERSGSGLGGARLRVARPDGTEVSLDFPLAGEAAAVDLVAALAAVEAIAGRLDGQALSRALAAHPFDAPGRLQVRRLASGTTVLDDTYNANPQSMRAALRTLAEVADGRRRVVVLGEMRELGAAAEEEHTGLGAAIVEAGAGLAVSCGGLADLAVRAAERSGVAAAYGKDADDAARAAAAMVRAADVVLVKASRAVGAERVVRALVQAAGGEAAAVSAEGAG